ncbi:hypothetical protein ABK040_008737 [Willaertia magna]
MKKQSLVLNHFRKFFTTKQPEVLFPSSSSIFKTSNVNNNNKFYFLQQQQKINSYSFHHYHTSISLTNINNNSLENQTINNNNDNKKELKEEELVNKWIQIQLQELIIPLNEFKSINENNTFLEEKIKKIENEIKNFKQNYEILFSENFPQLIALEISLQFIKENYLSKNKLKFTTSKLENIIKNKINDKEIDKFTTLTLQKRNAIHYLYEMNKIFSILQLFNLSKQILQKLIIVDLQMHEILRINNNNNEINNNGTIINEIILQFNNYLQLATIYEKENQINNAISTLIKGITKIQEMKSEWMKWKGQDNNKNNNKNKMEGIMLWMDQYLVNVHRKVAILFEELNDWGNAINHLEKANDLLQNNNYQIKKEILLKLGYLYTMNNELKQADLCYERITLLILQQLTSMKDIVMNRNNNEIFIAIIKDAMVVGYEWLAFIRKLLKTKQEQNVDYKEEGKDSSAVITVNDIQNKIMAIDQLKQISVKTLEHLNIKLDDNSAQLELQQQSYYNSDMSQLTKMIHLLEMKVFQELMEIQLTFIPNILIKKKIDWELFDNSIWNHLLGAMNTILTAEQQLMFYTIRKDTMVWKQMLIFEGIYLLKQMISVFKQQQEEEGTEDYNNFIANYLLYYDNLIIMISRNDSLFENNTKLWKQLRMLLGLINDPMEFGVLQKEWLEEQLGGNYHQLLLMENLPPNELLPLDDISLPFNYYDVVVEVSNSSINEEEQGGNQGTSSTSYKRAYRILAPTSDKASDLAVQFERYVVQGISNVIVELHRCFENSKRQTILNLLQEKGDEKEIVGGILSVSSKIVNQE